jgi:hypothetical protein
LVISGRGSHTPGDVDIAETNLIPLEDEECGMFGTICRVNHCCSPNARWAWSSREGKMGEFTLFSIPFQVSLKSALIALSDIAIGKEITVSYLESVDLLAPDRQEMIQSSFNFECLCRICALDPADLAKSNSRRTEIKDTFDKWDTVPIDEWSTSGLNLRENKLHTLKQMDHLATILEKESLPIFAPRLLEYRFQLHAAWGEYREAQKVGKEWEVIEKKVSEAPGRVIVSEGVKMIRKDPRKWGEWGKLRKLDACREATQPVKFPHDQSSKGEAPPRNLGLKCAG